MSAEENIKLREYKDLIEIIAKVEYQKFSRSHLIELPELINIGTHTLYILFKNRDPQTYNSTSFHCYKVGYKKRSQKKI